MTFAPVVPLSGNAGWAFLQRTQDAQQNAFNQSRPVQTQTAYFAEKISTVETAEQLVSDRRLLSVALGAFGLSDQINSTALIRQVLESDTLDPNSLANRLSDARFARLSEAFGFGTFDTPNTKLSDFGAEIIGLFQTSEFERAVGAQNESLRTSLGFGRELSGLLDEVESEDAVWFSIMGTPPLRRVFEGAFGLPTSIGALDIDRQLEIFKERAFSVLGSASPEALADPENQRDLLRRFLAVSEISASGPSVLAPGATALAILQQSSQPLI